MMNKIKRKLHHKSYVGKDAMKKMYIILDSKGEDGIWKDYHKELA